MGWGAGFFLCWYLYSSSTICHKSLGTARGLSSVTSGTSQTFLLELTKIFFSFLLGFRTGIAFCVVELDWIHFIWLLYVWCSPLKG